MSHHCYPAQPVTSNDYQRQVGTFYTEVITPLSNYVIFVWLRVCQARLLSISKCRIAIASHVYRSVDPLGMALSMALSSIAISEFVRWWKARDREVLQVVLSVTFLSRREF